MAPTTAEPTTVINFEPPAPQKAPEAAPQQRKTSGSEGTGPYRLTDIMKPRPGEEQNKNFDVSSETKAAAAETVQYLYTVFSKPPVPGALDAWSRDFLTILKREYPDINKDNIKEKANAFVRSTKGLAASIKYMEWVQMTYQKSTGATIDEIHIPDKQYRPKMTTLQAPSEGGAMMNEKNRRSWRWKFGINTDDPLVNHFLGRPLTDVEMRQRAEDEENKNMPLSEKDQNIHMKVDFPPGALNFSTEGLTGSQKAILIFQQRATAAGGVTMTGKKAVGEQEFIEDYLIKIAKARVNFYTEIGKPRGDLTLNAIDAAHNYLPSFQSPFLEVENTTEEAGVAGALNITQRHIELLQKDIKKKTSERFAEEKKNKLIEKQETDIVTSVREQLTSLQGDERKLSPIEEKRKKELDKQLTELRAQLTALEGRESKEKDVEVLKREIQNNITALNEHVDTSSGGLFPDAVELHDTILPNLKKKITDIEAERDRYKAEYDAQVKSEKELKDSVSSAKATNLPAINLNITRTRNRIIELEALLNGKGAKKGLLQELQDLEEVREEYEGYLNPLPDKTFNDLKAQREALKLKEIDLSGGGIAQILRDENKIKKPEQAREYLDTEIQRLQDEENRLTRVDPEQIAKRQALEVYRDYILAADKKTAIENRARSVQDKKTREPVPGGEYYGAFSKTYLKTMEILFGSDILSAGKDTHERFIKGTTMLPPDKLLEYYNLQRPRPPIGPPSPPIADLDDIDLRELNPKFMKKLLETLGSEVKEGKLGTYAFDQGQRFETRGRLEIVARIEADKKEKIDPVASHTLEVTYPYYRNVDDLVRRLVEDAGEQAVFNIDDPSKAVRDKNRKALAVYKKLAEEIDLLRKRRWTPTDQQAATTGSPTQPLNTP